MHPPPVFGSSPDAWKVLLGILCFEIIPEPQTTLPGAAFPAPARSQALGSMKSAPGLSQFGIPGSTSAVLSGHLFRHLGNGFPRHLWISWQPFLISSLFLNTRFSWSQFSLYIPFSWIPLLLDPPFSWHLYIPFSWHFLLLTVLDYDVPFVWQVFQHLFRFTAESWHLLLRSHFLCLGWQIRLNASK